MLDARTNLGLQVVEEVKRFFGQDLAFLERDVRERKIRAWACAQ